MLIDRPNVREGSYIQNARIAFGTSNPSNPDPGELFFRTDLGSLIAYNGSVWVEAGSVALAAHTADAALHLTPAQNTLLDGLASTLTATELNYMDGVTSSVQTQFTTLSSNLTTEISNRTAADTALQTQITTNASSSSTHATDYTLHLTSTQNTWIDAITATSTEVNFLSGVTSAVQTQLNTNASNLSTHISDATVHLTAAQNTLLDNITGVTYLDVNTLSGIQSYLSGQGSASIASYLSTLTNNKVSKSGDTMTGNLTFSGGAKVTGLPTPTLDADAVNKAYVDALAGGIDWKQAVKAATTGPIALSGAQTLDGVAVVQNDRVLVKDQAAPSQNGIYLVNSSGAWSRAPDYDSALEISQSAVYVLAGGTLNGRGSFVQTANITNVNVDSIVFTPFTGPVVNTAGNGIDLGVNGTVSVKNGAGISFDGSLNMTTAIYSGGGLMTTSDGTNSSSTAGAGLSLTKVGTAGTYRSVTTDVYGRVTSGTNPTTLGGYGITDAQPLDADLTAIAAFTAIGGFATRTATNTWTLRTIGVSGTGLGLSNGDGIAGNPTITINATNANTANTIVARDGSGNFTAGTITATLSGNATSASTATSASKLLSPSQSITDVNTAPTLNQGDLYFQTFGTAAANNPAVLDNANGLLTMVSHPTGGVGSYGKQLSFADNDELRMRAFTNGSFGTWRTLLHSGNYSSYGPTFAGAGATGTWNININGSATSASIATTQADSDASTNIATTAYVKSQFTTASASTTLDWNDGSVIRPGVGPTLLHGQNPNGPGISAYFHPLNFEYAGDLQGSGQITQLGVAYASPANELYMRGRYTGAWNTWTRFLNDANFNTYAPTLTGGGASGTWSINVTGNSGNTSSISNAVGNSYNWTGTQYFDNSGVGGLLTSTSPRLQAYAATAAGNAAYMSFHRSGVYAINLGLDTDNLFKVGGWSDGNGVFRMTLTNTGVLTLPVGGYVDQPRGAIGGYNTSAGTGSAWGANIWAIGPSWMGNGAGTSYTISGNYGLLWLRGGHANAHAQIGEGLYVYQAGGLQGGIGATGTYTAGTYSGAVTGSSYGSMAVSTSTGGYAGVYLTAASGTVTGMHDTSGNGGDWDPTTGWHFHWNRANQCLALGGSNVTAGYRAQTNGSHYVSGTLYATGNVIAFSDSRVKTDVKPIENALEKIERLTGVSYTRIDTGDQQVGFIAQDVKEVVPEVVKETGDGDMLGVAYGNLTAVLVEAIKDLNKQVQDLKNQVAALQKLDNKP